MCMNRAHDRPDKALSIEIYSAADFCRMRQHWNGCGLLLHEYCHMIHQHVLGLENQRILDLYQDAKQSGRYERALRRDWAGKDVDYDLHYCMVDAKEFFAEISVTWWSRGYRDLDQPKDTTRMEDCSPPIMESNVRQRLQNHMGRLLDPAPPKEGHCNKFYPFTAGQFRNHDPELYQRMERLWESIASWKDEERRDLSCWQKYCWMPWSMSKRPKFLGTSDTVASTVSL